MWLHVVQVMSVLAVITNCAHIGITSQQVGRFFPALTESDKVYMLFAVEHLVLLVIVVINCIVPPVPKHVKRNVEHERFFARKARLQVAD